MHGGLESIQLDTAADVPLYRQLTEEIKHLIQSGQLERGDRLPPTRRLADQLGLNRTTVTAAYALLESDGLISSHVGRGSYVAAGQSGSRSLRWTSLFVESEADYPQLPPAPPGDLISFATSRPSADLFPIDEFRSSLEEVIRSDHVVELLQLGSPNGYAPLRRYLLDAAARAGLARSGDDILVTSGCQQALDLVQRVLIAPGEVVAIEDPVYPGVHHVLSRAGAKLVGVPVGASGIDLDRLERVLSETRPKALFVTPNFQNPTGATLPLASREALLRMTRRVGAIVIENDIYGELRYRGAAIPSLKQLDESGDVVHLNSYSKLAFPGLRVGWVTAPRPLVAQLVEAKQWSDLHSDHLSQAVLLRFAESGRLECHRQRVVKAGAERLAAALLACEECLPAGARYSRPNAGMSLWVELPGALDAAELLPRAHGSRVSYLPGRYFSVAQPHVSSLRLSFAGLSPERIRRGILILGDMFRAELERARQAPESEPAPAMV